MGFRMGFIDSEGARWLVKYLSIERIDGCFCLNTQRHFDKGEAFRAAGVTVTDYGYRTHLAVTSEELPDTPLAQFALEISTYILKNPSSWTPAL